MIDKTMSTWTEIAEEMGVNEATVRSYYIRGMLKYSRNYLRMFGIDNKPTFDLTDRDKFDNLTKAREV